MTEQNLAVAQQLLQKLGSGAPPAEVAAMATEDVSFEIPGDVNAFPWIGAKVGRKAFADFIRDQRELLTPNAFRVDDMLASDTRVVILGELSATIKRNGQTAETYFAIILTVTNGLISRYQMLEDSYAGSRAAAG